VCLLPVAPGTAAVTLLSDARMAMSRTPPDSTFLEDGSPSFKERGLSESKGDPSHEAEYHEQ